MVGGRGEAVLGAPLCVLRASSSTSSRASSPPSAALATLATTESAASGLDRSRLWCARNVAASRRNGSSAPSLQGCRGAAVQQCSGAAVQRCSGAVLQCCRGLLERRLTAPHSARRTWPTHLGDSRTPEGREHGGDFAILRARRGKHVKPPQAPKAAEAALWRAHGGDQAAALDQLAHQHVLGACAICARPRRWQQLRAHGVAPPEEQPQRVPLC